MTTPSTMLAAVWRGPGQLDLEDRAVPAVIPGSLLIKVKACAICGSDIRIMNNGNSRIKEPRILGHEAAGEVVAIGEGTSGFAIGDRVTLGADIPCGNCDHCRSGRANCCDINFAVGYQFDGAFAEYMLINPLIVKNGPIQKFNEQLDWDEATLAEPLGCCLNGYERALYHPKSFGGNVVVFGAGPIGLMLLSLGRLFGAKKLIIIEPCALRRQLALKFGAQFAVDPSAENVISKVMEITSGIGAHAIFTACPSSKAHEQAIAIVAKRGVVNLFGGLPASAPEILLLSNHLHYREAYVTGSHGATPQHHAQALRMIQNKEIDALALISDRLPLSEIGRAFELAASGTAVKVIVNP
jgi:L-iditol 2-dehydrogenase